MVAAVLSWLPAAIRDRLAQDRAAKGLPYHGSARRDGLREHVPRRRTRAAVARVAPAAVRSPQAELARRLAHPAIRQHHKFLTCGAVAELNDVAFRIAIGEPSSL